MSAVIKKKRSFLREEPIRKDVFFEKRPLLKIQGMYSEKTILYLQSALRIYKNSLLYYIGKHILGDSRHPMLDIHGGNCSHFFIRKDKIKDLAVFFQTFFMD